MSVTTEPGFHVPDAVLEAALENIRMDRPHILLGYGIGNLCKDLIAARKRIRELEAALSGPTCTRCNQPLVREDGGALVVGGMHYECAVNEREMWGSR